MKKLILAGAVLLLPMNAAAGPVEDALAAYIEQYPQMVMGVDMRRLPLGIEITAEVARRDSGYDAALTMSGGNTDEDTYSNTIRFVLEQPDAGTFRGHSFSVEGVGPAENLYSNTDSEFLWSRELQDHLMLRSSVGNFTFPQNEPDPLKFINLTAEILQHQPGNRHILTLTADSISEGGDPDAGLLSTALEAFRAAGGQFDFDAANDAFTASDTEYASGLSNLSFRMELTGFEGSSPMKTLNSFVAATAELGRKIEKSENSDDPFGSVEGIVEDLERTEAMIAQGIYRQAINMLAAFPQIDSYSMQLSAEDFAFADRDGTVVFIDRLQGQAGASPSGPGTAAGSTALSVADIQWWSDEVSGSITDIGLRTSREEIDADIFRRFIDALKEDADGNPGKLRLGDGILLYTGLYYGQASAALTLTDLSVNDKAQDFSVTLDGLRVNMNLSGLNNPEATLEIATEYDMSGSVAGQQMNPVAASLNFAVEGMPLGPLKTTLSQIEVPVQQMLEDDFNVDMLMEGPLMAFGGQALGILLGNLPTVEIRESFIESGDYRLDTAGSYKVSPFTPNKLIGQSDVTLTGWPFTPEGGLKGDILPDVPGMETDPDDVRELYWFATHFFDASADGSQTAVIESRANGQTLVNGQPLGELAD